MNDTPARRAALRLATTCAGVGVALLTAASTPGTSAPTSPPAAARAQGIPWIWPSSNGPLAPYREAAVLVESLVLREHHVEHGGRTQPLPLAPDVTLTPVLHVESAPDAPDTFTATQRRTLLAAIRRHTDLAAAGSGTLQLDFEAPVRQREAYRALVAEIRAALPAQVRLSITALAHWCTQGDWLDRLPVDEVVPMLYHLGAHAHAWRERFTRGDPQLARRCRGPALGFSTNDPPPPSLLARTARPYWFDDAAWSNPSRPPRHLFP
jgi:hypothetical protein